MAERTPDSRVVALLIAHGGEITDSHGFARERGFIQHSNVSCYSHSVAVAYYSVRLAERLGLRYDRAALVRGALLHDYFLYDWHDPDPSHRLHGYHHSRRALENAARDYALTARERDIILHHMFPLTPAPPRSREAAIVCAVDKLCSLAEIFGGAPRLSGWEDTLLR